LGANRVFCLEGKSTRRPSTQDAAHSTQGIGSRQNKRVQLGFPLHE
jgi:hypothetical protein